MAFTGIPVEAVTFYEGLAADNSKAYWQAHKQVYEQQVRDPFLALLAEFDDIGQFRVFRPYNDVRFAKGRPPYKENIGGYTEGEGGTGYYVAFDRSGIYAGSGYYAMANDQLERFRAAIDHDRTGAEIATIVAALQKNGLQPGAMSELKTAPRGYPKDHPRIDLLRRKGLMAGKQFPLAKWMHTKAAVAKVRDVFVIGQDMSAWLDRHVGPSELPPEDAW